MTDEDIFDHEELTPEQRNAMDAKCDNLCLDCFGDGWVYINPGMLRTACETCKGTGNLPKADTGDG